MCPVCGCSLCPKSNSLFQKTTVVARECGNSQPEHAAFETLGHPSALQECFFQKKNSAKSGEASVSQQKNVKNEMRIGLSRKREGGDVSAHERVECLCDLDGRVWWRMTVEKFQDAVPPRKQERLCNDFEPRAERLWLCCQHHQV